jgi:hypothetical protein
MFADSRRMRESPLTAILSRCSLILAMFGFRWIVYFYYHEKDDAPRLLLYATFKDVVGHTDICEV